MVFRRYGVATQALPITPPPRCSYGETFNARPRIADDGNDRIRRLVAARIPELSVDEIAAALAELDPTAGGLLEIAGALDDIV